MRHVLISRRRDSEVNNSLKSLPIYHSEAKSTSLLGIMGTASVCACIGVAQAGDVDIFAGGELQFGLTTAGDEQLSDDEGDRGYAFFTQSELSIEADISPSEDLAIGAEVVLNADADIEEVNADETYMFIEGGFGLLQLGRMKGAEDAIALGTSTIAAGTGGIDGDTENLGQVEITGSEDAAKVSYYSPRLFGVQAGVSFTPDTGDEEGGSIDGEDDQELEDLEDHVGVGVNFVGKFDELEIGLAAVGSYGNSEDRARNDQNGFSIGGTLGFGEIELGVSLGENKGAEDFDFATLGTTVSIGKTNAGIGYNYLGEKDLGVTHVIVVSGDIEVLDGVELQADISYAEPEERRTSLASVFVLELSF